MFNWIVYKSSSHRNGKILFFIKKTGRVNKYKILWSHFIFSDNPDCHGILSAVCICLERIWWNFINVIWLTLHYHWYYWFSIFLLRAFATLKWNVYGVLNYNSCLRFCPCCYNASYRCLRSWYISTCLYGDLNNSKYLLLQDQHLLSKLPRKR